MMIETNTFYFYSLLVYSVVFIGYENKHKQQRWVLSVMENYKTCSDDSHSHIVLVPNFLFHTYLSSSDAYKTSNLLGF